MHAYVDESARVQPPGLYVVAAVIVPTEASEAVRQQARAAIPKRQLRFHWREESGIRRRQFIKAVVPLTLSSVVVATTPVEPKRTERARRLCLVRLLWELEQRRVYDVTIESRQANLNAADRSMIGYAQRAGQVSRELRYGFGLPKDEPLLWLPDAVAGAVTAATAQGERDYLDTLGASVTIIELPLK